MAIAPLLDTESADWPGDFFGASWPRPALQLVAGDEPATGAGAPVRRRPDVTERRSRRAALQRRRRVVVLAGVVAGLVCGLSLPFSLVGGSAPAVRAGSHGQVPGAAVYVVRPGDTLWSIAARFDGGGDPRPLAEALAKETGSGVVVPGERLSIP